MYIIVILLYYLLLFLTKYLHCVASPPDIGTLAVRRIYIVFKNNVWRTHWKAKSIYSPYSKHYSPYSKQLFAVQFIRFIYMNFSMKAIIYFEIKCCSSLNMIKFVLRKRQMNNWRINVCFTTLNWSHDSLNRYHPVRFWRFEEIESQLWIIISHK